MPCLRLHRRFGDRHFIKKQSRATYYLIVYFLALCQNVEVNSLPAKLLERAESWRYKRTMQAHVSRDGMHGECMARKASRQGVQRDGGKMNEIQTVATDALRARSSGASVDFGQAFR